MIKTFYHRAATYSLVAPFLAFALTLFLQASGVPTITQTRSQALVRSIVLGSILLSGAICGIVSLFGIRKHGTSGILWRAIIGLLTFSLLVAAAIPAYIKTRELMRQRYQQLYGQPPP